MRSGGYSINQITQAVNNWAMTGVPQSSIEKYLETVKEGETFTSDGTYSKDEFIKLVSKIDTTFENEFKAEFNSPELIWNNVIKDMSKKLTQTFNGDKQKQIDTILKILYAIRDDGQFYFFEYGKDLIERYLEDNMKECKEEIKYLKALVDNKNAFIDNTEK